MSFHLYNPRDTTYGFLELTWTKTMIVARIFWVLGETSRSPPSCPSSNTCNHLPACPNCAIQFHFTFLPISSFTQKIHIIFSARRYNVAAKSGGVWGGRGKLKFQIFFLKKMATPLFRPFGSPKSSSPPGGKNGPRAVSSWLSYCTVRQRK